MINIQLIIVVCYVVGLFGISIWANRLASKGSEAFILANRSLTVPLIAVSIAGLAIGGASTIGVAENAYKVGLSAGWYDVAWAIGAVVMALVAAEKYRSMNITTVPEMFEKYYDSKARIICVISQIIIQVVITSLQYVAGGAILAALLPTVFTFKTGMITSAIVFISITLLGGLWSASLSNILNLIIIYIGTSVGAIMLVNNYGGIANILSQLPSETPWLNPVSGLGVPIIISWIVVMTTQTISGQWTVQIANAAKDVATAKKGFLLGALLMIPVGFLSALMGVTARAALPDISPTLALPKVIMTLNPIVGGLTLSGLWAADVSTACGLLLGSATLVSQDLWKRYIKPDSTDQQILLISRGAVLGLGIITFVLAFTVVGVLKTLLIGLSLTTAFTVVFLFTVFVPELCSKNAAFTTTVVGIITLIAWQLIPEIRVVSHPIYLEWIVCPITFISTSLVEKVILKNNEAVKV